ncbi:hypothetical protein [Paraburkholderia azotifigens]|uniref:hypothetical protein n=1 Tax=Paraburkholderia azotifigens TaxID=2057004 RepID=UPI0038B7A23D
MSLAEHARFDTDALLNGAGSIVMALADCGYTGAQIKDAFHPKMIKAYLALREKRVFRASDSATASDKEG